MTSVIKKAGLLAATFTVLTAGTASASTLQVTVPFSFVLHGQTLPACEYRVTNDEGVVRFCGEKSFRSCINVMTSPASGQDPKGDTPAIIFKRDGNTYRVSDIWESSTEGLQVNDAGAHHAHHG